MVVNSLAPKVIGWVLSAPGKLIHYGVKLVQAATGSSSEVQLGQRLALIGISVRQNGHSLVVGSSGGASSSRLRLFMPLISINTAKATIRKLTILLKKTP